MKHIKTKIKKWLVLQQDRTGLDNLYYAKNFSFVLIDYSISFAKAFIISIILTRLLPIEIYGQYKYILTIITISTSFSLPGMNIALIQAAARGFHGNYRQSLKKIFQYSWLSALFIIVVSFYFKFYNDIEIAKVLLYSSLLVPFYATFGVYNYYLQGIKKFNKQTKYNSFVNLTNFIVILLTIFFTKNLTTIILMNLFSLTLTNLYFEYKILKTVENEKVDKDNINYGKKLSLINILLIVRNQADKLLVSHFLGFQHLAIYSIANIIPDQFKALSGKLISVSFPKLANKDDKIFNLIVDKIKKNLPILTSISLMIILSPFIIKIIFPANYWDAIPYSIALAFAIIIAKISSPFFEALKAQKKIKAIYNINIVFSLTEIILMFLGILFFDIWGLIFAKLLSKSILSIIIMINSKKELS